ncbi:hypothetical protein [Lentzea sp.]|uniref:hypothetical protein n=1 Tax=Lentzea sp. TaxID=56099 RepID=UPI002B516DD4|nr:hypothetical protein [Lentzea sp.]HUQ58814.1 hypothetical protein [Lentzea sp.]
MPAQAGGGGAFDRHRERRFLAPQPGAEVVGQAFGHGQEIGHGWNGFDIVLTADVTGDGYTDMVARKPADGSMWLYANNIIRDNGRPYSQGEELGFGWSMFDIIM